jgi:hypothetical protein
MVRETGGDGSRAVLQMQSVRGMAQVLQAIKSGGKQVKMKGCSQGSGLSKIAQITNLLPFRSLAPSASTQTD